MRVCNGCGSTVIEHFDLQKSIGHETLEKNKNFIFFYFILFLFIEHLIIQMIQYN
jgi:hypothetical protein